MCCPPCKNSPAGRLHLVPRHGEKLGVVAHPATSDSCPPAFKDSASLANSDTNKRRAVCACVCLDEPLRTDATIGRVYCVPQLLRLSPRAIPSRNTQRERRPILARRLNAASNPVHPVPGPVLPRVDSARCVEQSPKPIVRLVLHAQQLAASDKAANNRPHDRLKRVFGAPHVALYFSDHARTPCRSRSQDSFSICRTRGPTARAMMRQAKMNRCSKTDRAPARPASWSGE